MNILLSSLEQGLIYAILALGVHLTFKVLRIADMSVEGSFPFGALVTAGLLTAGVNPLLATLLALGAGLIPGIISALIAQKIKINPLLAGILTMTMFYSINLKVNGRPNVPISDRANILSLGITGNPYLDKLIVLALIVMGLKLALDWFFKTKAGYMLISTGDNQDLVVNLGQSPDKYKLIGLGLSNGLVALSGSLFAQATKFADTQMGIGTLVIALASLIIGETMFKKTRFKATTKVIIGAIIYKCIGALALELGLEANDLKLVNAMIVILFIAYNNADIKMPIPVLGKGGNHAKCKANI